MGIKHHKTLTVLTGNDFMFRLFCTALNIWICYLILNTSLFAADLETLRFLTLRNVGRMVFVSVFYCELVRIAKREYSLRDAIALGLAFLMCRGFYLHQDWIMLYSTIAVFGARAVHLKRLLRPTLVVLSATVLFIIACSQVGVIRDIVLDHGHSRIRHYLGFRYTLFPAQYALNFTLVLCYLLDRKVRVAHAVLLCAMHATMYYLTRSRITAFLGVIITLAFFIRSLPLGEKPKWKRMESALAWAIPISIVATIAVSLLYVWSSSNAPEIAKAINSLVGGRLKLQVTGLETLGVRPFGQTVAWVGNGLDSKGTVALAVQGYNYVDNLFIHSLIQHGWIYTGLLMVLITSCAWKANRADDAALVLVIAAIATQALVDDLSLYLNFCTMWLALSRLYQHVSEWDEGAKSPATATH